jgi:hypothetical protein
MRFSDFFLRRKKCRCWLSFFSCTENETFCTYSNFEAAVGGLRGVRPIPQEPQAARVEHRLLRSQFFSSVDSSSIFHIYIDPRRASTGLKLLGFKLGVSVL